MPMVRVTNGGTSALSLGGSVTGYNNGGSTGTCTYTISNLASNGVKEIAFTCNRGYYTYYSFTGATLKERSSGGAGSVFILTDLTDSVVAVTSSPGTSDNGSGYYVTMT